VDEFNSDYSGAARSGIRPLHHPNPPPYDV
jgi:hypothetical protein